MVLLHNKFSIPSIFIFFHFLGLQLVAFACVSINQSIIQFPLLPFSFYHPRYLLDLAEPIIRPRSSNSFPSTKYTRSSSHGHKNAQIPQGKHMKKQNTALMIAQTVHVAGPICRTCTHRPCGGRPGGVTP
jgi:hypothetical protein